MEEEEEEEEMKVWKLLSWGLCLPHTSDIDAAAIATDDIELWLDWEQ